MRDRHCRSAIVRSGRGVLTAVLGLAVLGLGAGGCGKASMQISRDFDTDELEANTPESYVDRWGDPDEWTDEKDGSELQSTMIWRCLDGEYREMVWRLREQSGGRKFWVLISDVTRKGICPEG